MKTLIRTIEEFTLYVGVASSFELEPVMGDILLVEDEHLRKYLGNAFYELLLEKYEAQTLTDKQKVLLGYLQGAIANLAMEGYMALNQVDITNLGIHIHSDQSVKTAFQWQTNELRRSLLKKGYSALEKSLQYLIANVEEADFIEWKNSGILSQFRRNFINAAAEFSEHYSIRNSWLTFLGLQPVIRKVERMGIIPQIGEELADEISTQIKAGTVSEDNKRLLEYYIQPALAHLTVAKALVEQGFELTPDGIEITYARIDEGNAKEADADNAKLLESKIREAEVDGLHFLHKMRQYLDRNASETKYAAYFTSDRYSAPVEKVPLNQSTNRTFRAF
ncbi:hypothetical protein GU926_08170 [Nibribacter ruber]|uniref:Uncharacterized protein n=1 Tax=Nibribacter ruber TaxID=2698458 RepID=A0A6P1NZP2_9BACT|nr:DUF6712 family protein [Nibribacter ruber]QHL87411.1 hypothetical protein GU926_08170 [Nibribacter ruber]